MYLTANQVGTARAKATDFGTATLYLLPEPNIQGPEDPGSYANALCVFANADFAILIKPDGKWEPTSNGKKVEGYGRASDIEAAPAEDPGGSA